MVLLRIGIIGTGNLGASLAKALVEHGSILAQEIGIYNRTPAKAWILQEEYGCKVYATVENLIEDVPVVILAVRLSDAHSLLQMPIWGKSPLLLSAVGGLGLKRLEQWVPSPVVRFLPSVTLPTGRGTLLFSSGTRVASVTEMAIRTLMKGVGQSLFVPEEDLRIASDLTSCGPGFLGALLNEMVKSASERTSLPASVLRQMVTETAIAFGQLLDQGKTPEQICRTVAVPGGVTEAGLKTLVPLSSQLWRETFTATAEYEHKKM